MKVGEKTLRDITGDRRLMVNHGDDLVRNLLEGLIELEYLGVTLRTMNPRNISTNSLIDTIIFNHVNSARKQDSRIKIPIDPIFPYSSTLLWRD